MEHNLFKPETLEQAMHTVVGDCNGIPAKERWDIETPFFAQQLAKLIPSYSTVLDYGCGCGRLAKAVLAAHPTCTVIGLDASAHELKIAKEYVNDSRFIPVLPHQLNQKIDIAYSVYCLQHVPAIDLRTALLRIHHFLTLGGKFLYCSSDYRMAIRHDGGGFCDDQFLGVNIRDEISKLFKEQGDLFSKEDLAGNDVVRSLIENHHNIAGGIPHPAKIYTKRQIEEPVFNAFNQPSPESSDHTIGALNSNSDAKKKLILRNRLAPGDILVMSVALRALHKAFPDRYLTDVDTPCNAIYENHPLVTPLAGDPNAQVIDMQYPEIHKSGASGRHFTDGYRKFLEEKLELEIPRVGLLPDIYLSHDEKNWPSPVLKKGNYSGRYWVLNAGSKSDYELKQYHRWQEVVDLWNLHMPDVKLVQIGQAEHNHPALNGVIDLRGKTNVRELFRTIHHAEGVLSCVSFPMHIAAALDKPCVVVAGGREPIRWEMYGNHRYLALNGSLDCAQYDGCWKSKLEECSKKVAMKIGFEGASVVPLCMEMISPAEIVRAAETYYIGGMIKVVEHA